MLTMEALQPLLAEVPANPPVRTSDTALMLDVFLARRIPGRLVASCRLVAFMLVTLYRLSFGNNTSGKITISRRVDLRGGTAETSAILVGELADWILQEKTLHGVCVGGHHGTLASCALDCSFCVPVRAWRLGATAPSTSRRGALHQLYTRGGV